MLSLDIEGRALVLLQSDVPDFVDSPWEALPSLRSGREMGWREGRGRGKELKLGFVCKMRNYCFKINKQIKTKKGEREKERERTLKWLSIFSGLIVMSLRDLA